MKFVVAFSIVASLFVAFASAASIPEPSEDEAMYEMVPVETDESNNELVNNQASSSSSSASLVPHVRERRLTCDFFSFSSKWFTPNHAACATKCIGMRRRGGRCRNGYCVCRNDRW